MILSCNNDSEQSQANYRNSRGSRCLTPTPITVTHQSTIHAVFQILCSRIHTSVRTELQNKSQYAAACPSTFCTFRHCRGVICPKLETRRRRIPLLGCWTDEDDHYEGMIDDSGHGESCARLLRARYRDKGVPQVRKKTARGEARCERVARPKLFGAAGRESVRAMRSAKVVDPPPRFGSGGTDDLDTNRGPPIPTPNAKKLIRVHACVSTCVRVHAKNFHSLECFSMWETTSGGPSRELLKFSTRFTRTAKEMKIW